MSLFPVVQHLLYVCILSVVLHQVILLPTVSSFTSCDICAYYFQFYSMWYMCLLFPVLQHVIYVPTISSFTSCDICAYYFQFYIMWYMCLLFPVLPHEIYVPTISSFTPRDLCAYYFQFYLTRSMCLLSVFTRSVSCVGCQLVYLKGSTRLLKIKLIRVVLCFSKVDAISFLIKLHYDI